MPLALKSPYDLRNAFIILYKNFYALYFKIM